MPRNIEAVTFAYPDRNAQTAAVSLWAAMTGKDSTLRSTSLPFSIDTVESAANKGKKWLLAERLVQRKNTLREMGKEAILFADFTTDEYGRPTLAKQTITDAKIVGCLQLEGMYSTVILPHEPDDYEFARSKDEKVISRLAPVSFEEAFGRPIEEVIDLSAIKPQPKILEGVM